MRVWGIASRENDDLVRRYVAQHGLTFPVLLDRDGAVNALYRQSPAFPTAAYPQDWIIGADGRVAYVHNGFEPDAMQAVLEAWLEAR